MDSLVQWFTITLGPYVSKEALIFIISLLPILELRGGLLAASLLKVEYLTALPICVIGNILPIPFILLFIRKILRWMKRYPRLGRIANKLESRAARKSAGVRKSELIGLCILVALPLPGTGAWTGALVAALMEMRLKRAIPTIFVGVLIAGILVTLACTGVKALRFLV